MAKYHYRHHYRCCKIDISELRNPVLLLCSSDFFFENKEKRFACHEITAINSKILLFNSVQFRNALQSGTVYQMLLT